MTVTSAIAEPTAQPETRLPELLPHTDSTAIEKALVALESGALVVAPTDTRYGLLGRADKLRTLERLFQTKQRPAELVTAVFVSSVSDIARWAEITPIARKLLERFLPGPLTLVMQATDDAKRKLAPQVVRNGEIGIRVSASSFMTRLLAQAPFPLTATSANISGCQTHVEILDIAEQFGERVALYIDGGALDGDVSTVVRCSADCIEILRKGALPIGNIRTALGNDAKVICHD